MAVFKAYQSLVGTGFSAYYAVCAGGVIWGSGRIAAVFDSWQFSMPNKALRGLGFLDFTQFAQGA